MVWFRTISLIGRLLQKLGSFHVSGKISHDRRRTGWSHSIQSEPIGNIQNSHRSEPRAGSGNVHLEPIMCNCWAIVAGDAIKSRSRPTLHRKWCRKHVQRWHVFWYMNVHEHERTVGWSMATRSLPKNCLRHDCHLRSLACLTFAGRCVITAASLLDIAVGVWCIFTM